MENARPDTPRRTRKPIFSPSQAAPTPITHLQPFSPITNYSHLRAATPTHKHTINIPPPQAAPTIIKRPITPNKPPQSVTIVRAPIIQTAVVRRSPMHVKNQSLVMLPPNHHLQEPVTKENVDKQKEEAKEGLRDSRVEAKLMSVSRVTKNVNVPQPEPIEKYYKSAHHSLSSSAVFESTPLATDPCVFQASALHRMTTSLPDEHITKLTQLNSVLTDNYSSLYRQMLTLQHDIKEQEIINEGTFYHRTMNQIKNIFNTETTEALRKIEEAERRKLKKYCSRRVEMTEKQQQDKREKGLKEKVHALMEQRLKLMHTSPSKEKSPQKSPHKQLS